MTPYPDIPTHVETERLVIRPPTVEDVPAIYAAVIESLEDLKPRMPWSHDYTMDGCEASTRAAVAKFITREDLRYHFHDKKTGELIANSGLHAVDWKVPKFEIGYWCRTSKQGQGYVTEGVKGLTEMAFRDLKAVRLEIQCDDRNLKSAAVAERCGYGLEGTLKFDSRSPDGELTSTRIYARTRKPGENIVAFPKEVAP